MVEKVLEDLVAQVQGATQVSNIWMNFALSPNELMIENYISIVSSNSKQHIGLASS